MAFEAFEDLYDAVMEHYGRQEFASAYELLTAEGPRFPEDATMALYLRSCLAARLGERDQAIAILREALDRGFWFSEAVMRQSPSWQPLQGEPAFEELAAVAITRAEAARADPLVLPLVPLPGLLPGQRYPLVFALHGNGDNAAHTLRGWGALAQQGWLLAALQSSQPVSSSQFVWDDQERALADIASRYERFAAEFPVDQSRVILAGFSMGGETALRACLAGTIPARGFLLLGPGGPTIDEPQDWLPLIEAARGRGLRGYILMGETDATIPHDAIRELAALLNREGIPCELEEIPGLRHDYPADAGPYLRRALAFIGGR